MEMPAYSLATAARYLRVKRSILYNWTHAGKSDRPLVKLPDRYPSLSFANLLECHVLKAFMCGYCLRLPRVMTALRALNSLFESDHPLLSSDLTEGGLDVFLINASSGTHLDPNAPEVRAFRNTVQFHFDRIAYKNKIAKLFPLVGRKGFAEPRLISVSPIVAFGRSVIDGTGISTAVIAGRFKARESIHRLSREYRLKVEQVEEAIRWETDDEIPD